MLQKDWTFSGGGAWSGFPEQGASLQGAVAGEGHCQGGNDGQEDEEREEQEGKDGFSDGRGHQVSGDRDSVSSALVNAVWYYGNVWD